MANKKVSQLTSKPSVLVTDLFPIADPSTGQLYKTTISDLGTAIGSGVSSVNGLVGAVVLDTDDIQELVSPTNKWFTDTRARAALSASSPLAYNSGTGVFSIPAATSSQNGYLSSTDWTTFNNKLSTATAASTYLALTGGTLTGTLIGTRAEFTTSTLVDGVLVNNGSGRGIRIVNAGAGYGLIINNETASSAVPFVIQKSGLDKIYFTDSGAGNFSSSLTASSFVKSGGTSSQFLKADGSVDSSVYALDSAVVHNTGNETIAGQKTFSSGLFGTSAVFSSAVNVQSINVTGITSSPSVYITTNGTNHAVSIVQSGAGYAIYASGNVAVIGTGYFSSSLTAASLSSTAGYNFTLPSASGTIALTSNLSSYLPLSGGTLTGALSGTSATFSSSVTATQGTFSSTSGNQVVAYYGASDYLNIQHNGLTTKNNQMNLGTNLSSTPTMALVGTNVGIGTTLPQGGAGSTDRTLSINSGSGAASFLTGLVGDVKYSTLFTSSSIVVLETNASIPLAFNTNGTERIRITNGGVLGVGITNPSNWDNTIRAIEVGQNGNFYAGFNGGSATYIGSSAYYNGGWKYSFTGGNPPILLDVGAGSFTVRNAANGTAGASLSWNTVFTVNSNRNVIHTAYNVGEGMLWSYNGGATYGFYNANNGTFVLTNSGVANVGSFNMSTGIYTPLSDKNKKKDFEESNIGLNEVMQLKPTLYRMKTDESEGIKELGFIAQDVKSIIPNAYVENEDFIGLNFNPIVVALTKAVQELKAKIDILENK